MAKLIIPVIPVTRSFMERLAKARGGLVQKQVQVKTRTGNHTRMQWVRPENDSAKGGDQPGLFDDVDKPKAVAKPVVQEPKKEEIDELHPTKAQLQAKIDEAKKQLAVFEKTKGRNSDHYRTWDDKLAELEEWMEEDYPEGSGKAGAEDGSASGKPAESVYDKAKGFLADNGFIVPDKGQYSSEKFPTLIESLRQSGALTPADEKALAVEHLTASIKGFDVFARRNNGRMPAVDRAAKKAREKQLAEIKGGGSVPVDILRSSIGGAARDFTGSSSMASTPWHPEDYKFEDESNKRLAEMLSTVVGRHVSSGKGLRKSIFDSFRDGLAKAFGSRG